MSLGGFRFMMPSNPPLEPEVIRDGVIQLSVSYVTVVGFQVEEIEIHEDLTFPEVTISAETESGLVESSIEVPLQRAYTGRKPVIPSSLADTPCAALGVQGVLERLNATLGTSHTLDTSSLSSVLEDCIINKYDFGTVYGRLRQLWGAEDLSTIQEQLNRLEKEDKEKRKAALVGKRIVNPRIPPRRVWDLYSNRVVPYWSKGESRDRLRPISHAWMADEDRAAVFTPINGYEWPVPIPKDANLDTIRIEMLNHGAEYTWLDVLCLRQKHCGQEEPIRGEEWEVDVPTIGYVYETSKVVTYLGGLGRPLRLKAGDLESERCWFRRAWTLQEVRDERIIAGDTPGGPMHARPIDQDENDETNILTMFHKKLESLPKPSSVFGVLASMQTRTSTNPVDKVAGLAFPLQSKTIPAYNEHQNLEDAWSALVEAMSEGTRGEMFFLYPEAGPQGQTKWRPTWAQVMDSESPLPVDEHSATGVGHDEETNEDWCEGLCIEKGRVQGLAVTSEAVRYGELVVEDADGITHSFKIHAAHQSPIPDDTYTLLGADAHAFVSEGIIHTGWLQRWVVGRRLPEQKFEKVSVFTMSDGSEMMRLEHLGIASKKSRNVLI